MASQWSHGSVASCWCRMPPAQIPTHLHTHHATSEAGVVAAMVETRKRAKYSNRDPSHLHPTSGGRDIGSFRPRHFSLCEGAWPQD